MVQTTELSTKGMFSNVDKIEGTFTLRNGLVKSTIGNSIMLYNIKNEVFYAFNETASAILELMYHNLSLPELKYKVGEYFDIKNLDEFSKDFERFLYTLFEMGFIQQTDIVNKNYIQCQFTNLSDYSKPVYKEYTKDWLVANHPGTFYNLCFSDTWSPASI